MFCVNFACFKINFACLFRVYLHSREDHDVADGVSACAHVQHADDHPLEVAGLLNVLHQITTYQINHMFF